MSSILDNYWNVGRAPDSGLSAHWPVAGADLPAASKGFRRHWHRLGNLRHKGRNDIIQIVENGIYVATANAVVANIATERTLIGAGVGTLVLATGSALDYPLGAAGKSLRLRAWGFAKTKADPVGTLRLKAKLGATVILDTGAQTLTASLVDRLWRLEGIATIRATGAAGTIMSQGQFQFQPTAQANPTLWEMLNLATVVIDTTASQTFDLTAQWATADVDNSITCTNFKLEYLF